MQARDALLDAAYDAAVTTGWGRARMADVAAAAGVSRQTLYDQFGSREGLAQQLALRETGRFLDGTESALAGHRDDIGRAVEAAVTFALTAARDNPLMHAILTENGEDGLLPYLTTRGEPVLAAARDRVVAYVGRHWPGVAPEDAALVGEVATRLTLSYLVSPAEGIPHSARRVARVVSRVVSATQKQRSAP